jgi:signal peptidase II
MADPSAVKALPNVHARRGEGIESAAAPPHRPFWFLLGAITIPIVVLDQATKLFVQAHMWLYESIPVIPNYLDITYTLNPGAAFSMLADSPPWVRKAFLLTMAIAAISVLTVLVVRADRISINSIAFALILAGATGNLLDRALRGRVVDFVRVHYFDLNYPVFNVADSAITIGVTLIIVAALFSNDTEDESNTKRSS